MKIMYMYTIRLAEQLLAHNTFGVHQVHCQSNPITCVVSVMQEPPTWVAESARRPAPMSGPETLYLETRLVGVDPGRR